jgi:hypothetical protein
LSYDQRERWNDPEEATRHAHEDQRTTIWTSMPCIIKEHNTKEGTAKVQIAIKLKHVDEKGKATWVPFPILEDVPVHYYGGGGVTITPPIKDGDEGIIHFNARSIDKWWQQGGVQEQTHARMHDISDGWLMPGGRSQPRKFSNVSKTSWQVRSDDGRVYVDFAPGNQQSDLATVGTAAADMLRVSGGLSELSSSFGGGVTSLASSVSDHLGGVGAIESLTSGGFQSFIGGFTGGSFQSFVSTGLSSLVSSGFGSSGSLLTSGLTQLGTIASGDIGSILNGTSLSGPAGVIIPLAQSATALTGSGTIADAINTILPEIARMTGTTGTFPSTNMPVAAARLILDAYYPGGVPPPMLTAGDAGTSKPQIKLVSPDMPVMVVGELHVTKTITCEGEVIAKSKGNNIHLSTHTHAQPNDSHGDTEQETQKPTSNS